MMILRPPVRRDGEPAGNCPPPDSDPLSNADDGKNVASVSSPDAQCRSAKTNAIRYAFGKVGRGQGTMANTQGRVRSSGLEHLYGRALEPLRNGLVLMFYTENGYPQVMNFVIYFPKCRFGKFVRLR